MAEITMVPRKEVSEFMLDNFGLDIPTHRLDRLRKNDSGPAFHKIGGQYFYQPDDLIEWIESSRVVPESTDTGMTA